MIEVRYDYCTLYSIIAVDGHYRPNKKMIEEDRKAMIYIDSLPNLSKAKRFACRCGCIWRATEADYHKYKPGRDLLGEQKLKNAYFISRCPFCGRDVISDDREG